MHANWSVFDYSFSFEDCTIEKHFVELNKLSLYCDTFRYPKTYLSDTRKKQEIAVGSLKFKKLSEFIIASYIISASMLLTTQLRHKRSEKNFYIYCLEAFPARNEAIKNVAHCTLLARFLTNITVSFVYRSYRSFRRNTYIITMT